MALAQMTLARNIVAMRNFLIQSFLVMILPLSAQAEPRFAVFGGILTDNPWEDVLLMPWRKKPQRLGLYGLAIEHPVGPEIWSRLGHVRFGVEAQLVRHEGLQRHWEVNLPLTVRLDPERRVLGVFDTFAFGIGPSFASRTPSFETKRGSGKAARNLVYWYLEAERRLSDNASIFGRLHHRSDAYGLVGPGASSNALVAGYRWGF